MQKDYFIKVAFHFSIYAAKGDSDWPFVFKSLAKRLRQYGCEEKAVKKHVLLFTFFHPYTAFSAVVENLQIIRRKYVSHGYHQPLPFKVIFHLDSQEAEELPINDDASDLWSFLEFEHCYVTKPLKDYLDRYALWQHLPEHTVQATDNIKLFDVTLSNPAEVKLKKLFPHRNLPLQGSNTTCFYCGMMTHKAADCPSKTLTMETQGLLDIGSLSFEQLGKAYAQAFSHFSKLTGALSSITPEKIHPDPALMALVSFFDVSHIFQLRFLFHMLASSGSLWPQLGRKWQRTIKNTTLQLALDCLIAGKYQEAQEKFESEASKALGELFYAHIGLAFVALEQGKDMSNNLGTAVSLASSPEEKIYAYLLLSRYYETTRENQKAETMMGFIDKLDFSSNDAAYRAFQIAAQREISKEDALHLKRLLAEPPFFMKALIDPLLLPVSGIAESLLLYTFQKSIHLAKSYYVDACKAYGELMALVDEREPVHDKIQQDLDDLKELIEKRVYNKIVGASKKARESLILCNNLKEKITFDIQKRQANIRERLKSLAIFWKSYPFKSFFKEFDNDLSQRQQKFDNVSKSLQKKDRENTFKKDKIQLNEVLKSVEELEAKKKKMVNLQNMLRFFIIFVQKLLLSESIMAFGGTALLLVIVTFVGTNPWQNILGSLRALPYAKDIMFLLLMFVAPLIALILTFRIFLNEKNGGQTQTLEKNS